MCQNPSVQKENRDYSKYSEPYERLVDGKKESKKKGNASRIARLRALLAVGLGREYPISQTELAFWCDMSRETIAAVESGKAMVSRRLAERIYDMTGADLSWLNGKANEESYDYPSLQAWFPKTMPLTKRDIERIHDYNNSPCYEYLHYILAPLAKRAYCELKREGDDVKLPAAVMRKAFDDFTYTDDVDGNPDGCPALWKAFAFAPTPEAIYMAYKNKMLDDAPPSSPLKTALELLPAVTIFIPDMGLMGNICHNLILTLSRAERGLI